MRKTAIALMCMIFATGIAVAQNNVTDDFKHEISLSYGTPFNSSNSCEFLADIWTGGLSNKSMDKDRYIGPLAIEYFYHVSPLVGIGGIGVFSSYKGVKTYSNSPSREHSNKYFTIMPAVKLNWLRRDKWGLYSKFAIGYTRGEFKITDEGTGASEETSSSDCLNFQVSAIGAEVGNQRVRGFAEIGFGEQGFGLAGVRFRF